jgi:hypothetical protein
MANQLFQHLDTNFQTNVMQKWKPVLDAAGGIKDYSKRLSTAIILENTQCAVEGRQGSRLNESYASSGMGGSMGATGTNNAANGGGVFAGMTGDGTYGAGDSRMPTIVIPTARRIFPELLAHEVVGVQPMTGPVGFAFAFRALYGDNGKGGVNGVAKGVELGYNQLDSQFTGATMGAAGAGVNAGLGEQLDATNAAQVDMWSAFSGVDPSAYGTKQYGAKGTGAGLNPSEWWGIGEDYPMAQFDVMKGTVEAKARKLGASWSLEMAEDIKAVQGADIEAEMTNIISYELKAELDREILSEMVKAAISGGATSTWSPVTADGRNQMERISTLYTHLLDMANKVSITTRRGPATFAIASPKVCALLERMGQYAFIDNGSPKVDTGVVGVAKVGTLRNGAMTLYRDTFAGGNYIQMGYKGQHPYDAGIIYCPYIPVELMKAMSPNTFAPRIGVRTRYGLLNNLYGAKNYYHFIKVDDLTNYASLVSDSESSRVFMA